VSSFGQYFVSNVYKKKRENVLFDIEKAMLPDTQPIAAQVLEIRNLQKEIEKKEVIVIELRGSISRLEQGALDSEYNHFLQTRKNYRMQIHGLQEDIYILTSLKDRINNRMYSRARKASKTQELVVKCPGLDCRGFAMKKASGNIECGLCKTVLCKECHEPLGQTIGSGSNAEALEHICDPNTLETVRMLKKDSKNCPSCKSLIFKIDGCDQMFCTQCHTAFSWRTGEVTTGRIHNPHYYEYLRRTGNQIRETGDVPCGGVPHLTYEVVKNEYYAAIHRIVSHFEYDEIRNLNLQINQYNGNQDLRISYLNNDITLEMFKYEIYRREKAHEKRREILTVLTTFVVVCSDIFRNILSDRTIFSNVTGNLEQFDEIRKFTNENLENVSRVYRCVVPFIDCTWVYSKRNYYK
jgi:hypothetical protein